MQFAIQTNAVLLDETTLAVLHRHAVRVGVSLDGPVAHDRHRRFADDEEATPGLRPPLTCSAPRNTALCFPACCASWTSRNDPLAVYDELLGYSPPTIRFPLPHGTWSAPPPGRRPDDPGTLYADWLIAISTAGMRRPAGRCMSGCSPKIIQLLLGGASGTESVGLTPSSVLVVETDGMLEQVDALKAAYDGAAATGLSVADGPLDLALRNPAILSRQAGVAALAAECRSCEVRDTCGGGFYPHRYRTDTGFDNPSVYCPDLLALVRHIRGRVHADLARALRRPR